MHNRESTECTNPTLIDYISQLSQTYKLPVDRLYLWALWPAASQTVRWLCGPGPHGSYTYVNT